MKLIRESSLSGHTDKVWSIDWSPIELAIVSSSTDKTIRTWTKTDESWRASGRLDDAHTRTIRGVSFAPDGRRIASSSFDSSTAIWERTLSGEFESMATLEGHENEVKSVAWSASGSLLATCSRDKSVWIWELIDDREFECAAVLQEHSQDVKMIAWHPHDDILISASYDDTIRVWREDEDDWYCAEVLKGHTSTVWGVDFNEYGDMIVSVSDDLSLKIWQKQQVMKSDTTAFNPKQFKHTCILTANAIHTRSIYAVSWSKVNGLIATCGGDNIIHIHSLSCISDMYTLDLVASISNAHSGLDVNCVRWCQMEMHGSLLASCGDDENVNVWRLQADVEDDAMDVIKEVSKGPVLCD